MDIRKFSIEQSKRFLKLRTISHSKRFAKLLRVPYIDIDVRFSALKNDAYAYASIKPKPYIRYYHSIKYFGLLMDCIAGHEVCHIYTDQHFKTSHEEHCPIWTIHMMKAKLPLLIGFDRPSIYNLLDTYVSDPLEYSDQKLASEKFQILKFNTTKLSEDYPII